jgi:hypothetical protein
VKLKILIKKLFKYYDTFHKLIFLGLQVVGVIMIYFLIAKYYFIPMFSSLWKFYSIIQVLKFSNKMSIDFFKSIIKVTVYSYSIVEHFKTKGDHFLHHSHDFLKMSMTTNNI